MSNLPDNAGDHRDDPASPLYHDPEADERAELVERFEEASREIEAIWSWLGEVWDQPSSDAADMPEIADCAESIAFSLRSALSPWRDAIIAHALATPRREPLRLMGVTIPAEGNAR